MAGLKDAVHLLKQVFKEFSDDDCPRMAAALAYYTVFSLPPLLVIIVTLAGLFLDPQQIEGWIEGQISGLIGQRASTQIQVMLESVRQRVQGGFSTGLILSIAGLLFGATGALAQFQAALNAAWEVEPDPEQGGLKNFLMKRLLSLGMILVIAFLLLVSLVISSLISAFSRQLGQILSPLGLSTISAPLVWSVDIAVSLLVIMILIAAIFKVLPDARIAWHDVWAGTFVTAFLFVAGKFLISLYIGRSDPGEIYGAAAALAIILVWVYYSAMIILLGAEFTQVWARHHGTEIQPETGAVKVVKKRHPVRPDSH